MHADGATWTLLALFYKKDGFLRSRYIVRSIYEQGFPHIMNQIKSINRINDRELENGILDTENSWHNEYKDQAYIYIGGLNKDLTEGDILTVFSQFGVPVDIVLMRDNQTGESRGFAYLKYEDQRSTILAIDNLNGIKLGGRYIRVDHAFFEPRSDIEEYRRVVKEELDRDIAIKREDPPVEAKGK